MRRLTLAGMTIGIVLGGLFGHLSVRCRHVVAITATRMKAVSDGGPAVWRRNSKEVTTPKLPPPPSRRARARMSRPRNRRSPPTVGSLLPRPTSAIVGVVIVTSSLDGLRRATADRGVKSRIRTPLRSGGQGLYRAAITSFEFMSIVRVHPEVPLNSNGAGLGPRR